MAQIECLEGHLATSFCSALGIVLHSKFQSNSEQIPAEAQSACNAPLECIYSLFFVLFISVWGFFCFKIIIGSCP